jgi:hypothetical protein
MLGESMIPWFDIFSGIIVYKIKDDGVSDNDKWINIDEYIKIFERGKLRLNGKPYEKGMGREEELTNAIITNAGILCELGLLERNRGTNPPRLEYRVTNKGRKFDQLRGSKLGELRRKLFFFRRVVFQRIKKYKSIVTVAAFLMAVVNAIRFYSLALTWISDAWVFIASAVMLLGVMIYAVLSGG